MKRRRLYMMVCWCAVAAMASVWGYDAYRTAVIPLPQLPVVNFSQLEPAVKTQIMRRADAVRRRPRDAEANGYLAMTYHSFFCEAAARVCYERARALAPRDFRWNYLLGIVRANTEPEAAIAEFRRAISIDEDYLPAYLRLGELLLAFGLYDEAHSVFAEACEHKPESVRARFGLGRAALFRNDVEEAIRQFDTALEGAPPYRQIEWALGHAYRRKGEAHAAEEHLRRTNGPVLPPIADPVLSMVTDFALMSYDHYNKAFFLLEEGETEEAIKYLHRALEANPKHATARVRLADILREQGRSDEALTHYKTALSADPYDWKARLGLACLYADQGESRQAIQQFQEVLEIRPDNIASHLALGRFFAQNKRTGEAARHFRRVLEIDPTVALANRRLAELIAREARTIESESGGVTGAYAMYLEGLIVEQASAPAYAFLADRLVGEGSDAAAMEVLSAGLNQHPHQLGLVRRKVQILSSSPDALLRDGGAAVRLAQESLRKTGTRDARMLDVLAMAHAEAGAFAEAVEVARQALVLASKQGSAALAVDIQSRLKMYEAGRAFHREVANP